MSAQPPKPNPLDELKTGLQDSPPLDELKAGLADKQPLVQGAQPRYAFGWFDKWLLAIPIAIGVVVLLLLWISCSGTPPPTTATLQAPAPDATLQVGEPLTITGTAPPNSTVQIYNHGQLVAETTADENGNFVVRFVPVQAGDYELSAVATADGQTLESPPISFVIADESGQTAQGPTLPASTLTAIAAAGASGTSVAGSAGGTPVPGTEGGAQGATTPGTESGAQGATTPGAEGGAQGATTPGTESGTPETSPTTATLNTPPADATLQAGESLTITGTAPPNSSVQIYNQGQVVAQTTADANGNFVVSFVPSQPGAYELSAVATAADGTTLESPPMQFVIAESSGQTPETSPTTATLNTPPADATLQAGESLTITGTAPPNSSVQIYNQGQLVAETTADANGNFVVSFVPSQPGAYELSAVATVDGQSIESPPVALEIAEGSGQTAQGPTLPASTLTAIAAAGASGTSVAGSAGGTPVPGTEGGAQGATTPGTESGAQGATTPGAEGGAQGATTPGTESGTPETSPTTATLNTPPADATLQAGESLTITGTAPPNSSVQIYNQGQVVAQTTADANGNFVVSFVPSQPGAYELSAVATAADGTTLESPPMQFVIAESSGQTPETSPTTATLNTPPADATLQAGESLTITGTAPPNSSVQIYNQGQLVAETTADANGNFVVSFVPSQPGAYELSAVATVDGQSIESPPVALEIAEPSGTPVAGAEGGAEGGAQGATTPDAQGGAQGATTPGAEGAQGATTPGAEGAQGATTPGAQGGTQGAPPTVHIMAGQGLAPGTQISGTGVPGTTVTLYLDEVEIGSAIVSADGTWQLVLPRSVEPGNYVLRVVVTSPDSASGATSESGGVTESEGIPVSIVAMTLPITGGKSRNHFSCRWLWSRCCWR